MIRRLELKILQQYFIFFFKVSRSFGDLTLFRIGSEINVTHNVWLFKLDTCFKDCQAPEMECLAWTLNNALSFERLSVTALKKFCFASHTDKKKTF